jgi:glycosyltransferase involved in cell wall biosynthesis
LRVLHLTPELPLWPGGTGGAARQFHLLRRLVELGHDVSVVAPATSEQARRLDALEAAGLRTMSSLRPESRWLETARALAGDPRLVLDSLTEPVLAWQVSVFWHRLRPIALRAAAQLRPDVLSVEHDHAAPWIRELPGHPPAVLTVQNVGWDYYRSRSAAARAPLKQALALEARRFRRFDARHLPPYDSLVAMSDADADALRSLGRPVEVVPNGVSTAELAAQPPAVASASLLFTGTMAYPPNAEGILWFAREVWPRIRAARPDVSLSVVGRDPPAAVRRLADDPGIEVTGTVDDVRPYFGRATAVVAPLRSGGGTRLKLLEAWSAQRAVVATPQAAAGLDFEPGRHALIEDRPDRFAEATLRVLREPGLRERLAQDGRALVERQYDWRSLGERFERVLTDAARLNRRGGP